jgi:arylsulfatase
MGDDIGYWNISAYNRGMMGYRTPNIDRIANEGAIFTDYYGQQSCTAGRAAFITGQSPLRTGLLKVGLPGAKEGLAEKDPTIAELLKPQATRPDNLVKTIWVTVTNSADSSRSTSFSVTLPPERRR